MRKSGGAFCFVAGGGRSYSGGGWVRCSRPPRINRIIALSATCLHCVRKGLSTLLPFVIRPIFVVLNHWFVGPSVGVAEFPFCFSCFVLYFMFVRSFVRPRKKHTSFSLTIPEKRLDLREV